VALEGLTLHGLALNDGESLSIEGNSFVFTPAQPNALWASNPDSDGQVLVGEPSYGPAYFEFTVRVERRETMDAALEKLGELGDALSACKRLEDGAPLEWQPAGASTTYTWYARLAEHSELPVTVEGDSAGWFLRTPLVRVKLTCDPGGETEEVEVKEATESGAEPIQDLYAKVGGDLPAKARAIITDKATQDRRYLAIGQQVVESEEQPTALLTAASLVTTNFSGASKTRSGAYSEEKVIRATAVSSPTVMCGTGDIEHIGPYRIRARVYAGSEDARFRISYKNGDGPWVPLEFVEAPVTEEWAEIDLGEVAFDEARLGSQASQIRVEAKSVGDSCENDLNYLLLMPSTAFVKARGIASNSATKLEAYDEFDQEEGNLEGKELPLGGTWAETNKTGASGFKVKGGVVERTAVSDSTTVSGCFAQAGSTKYTSFIAEVTVGEGTPVLEGATNIGVLGRYVSTEKWITAVLVWESKYRLVLRVKKNVEGGVTNLADGDTGVGIKIFGGGGVKADVRVRLTVTADGTWAASAGSASLSGHDPDLATGGALASGKVGLYDSYTSSSAGRRMMENFNLLAAEPAGRVCYSEKQVQWRYDGMLRQDSAGEHDGPPSLTRGANFYLAPEGDSGRINRLVIAMRRNDVDTEPAEHVEDKHTITIYARERFLLPR
jgi:hypothetical protein